MIEQIPTLGSNVSTSERRAFLKRSARALTAGAAASLPLPFIGSAQAQQAVKIGLVVAKQGPLAQQGEHLAQGAMMAFEQASRRVLDRPAELIWLDEPNPQGAVQNITKLIEEQKVAAVLGGVSSASSLAMGAAAQRARVPFIVLNGAAREITGKDCNPFMFRMQPPVPVHAKAMAPHLLALGKKWYFIIASFAFGEDVLTTFGDVLKAAGGSIVGVDRVPVATTDYSSFVLKARAASPDVVISGAATVEPILKQFKELGLTGRIPLAGPAVSDTDLWSVSPDALAGVYGKTWYYNDPDNSPAEQAFVQAYRAKEGRPPSDRTAFGWHGMRLLLAAIADAKSVEPVAVARSLEALKEYDGSLPLAFRKWDHQLVRRLIVAQARPNQADRWDILDIKSRRPGSAQELDQMYGTPAEVGCTMSPI